MSEDEEEANNQSTAFPFPKLKEMIQHKDKSKEGNDINRSWTDADKYQAQKDSAKSTVEAVIGKDKQQKKTTQLRDIRITANKASKLNQRSTSSTNVASRSPLPKTPEEDVIPPPVKTPRSRKSSGERSQHISRYNALTVLDATIRDGLKDNLRALITTKQVEPEQALEVALTRDQLTGNHIAIVDFLIKNEFIDMSTFVTPDTLERIYDKVRWCTLV